MSLGLRVLTPVLLAAVLTSGCGSTSSTPQTPQAQFAARADAVCTRAKKHGRELANEHVFGHRSAPAEAIRWMEVVRPFVERTEHELELLSPPVSARVAYGRFLTAITEEAHSLSELIGAMRVEDSKRYPQIEKNMGTGTIDREAKALGLGGCVEATPPHLKDVM